jgi:hypothetical protein
MSTELHPAKPDSWIDPEAGLEGVDGNAFSIMGFVRRSLKRAGNPPEVLMAYSDAAKSGDYDNLLRVSMDYCGELG